MANSEIKSLIRKIQICRNSKQQFNTYTKSIFAITEREYFLLDATSKFQNPQTLRNEVQKLIRPNFLKENLVIRANIIESVQRKIDTFNFLRKKFPGLNLHAVKVSALYLKDDNVIDRIQLEGVSSTAKDLNALIWPPKIRKEKFLNAEDFAKIIELQNELSKVSKLDQSSANEIIKKFLSVNPDKLNEASTNYIKSRKKNLIERYSNSSVTIEEIFSRAKKFSRAEAVQIYLERSEILKNLSVKNVENAMSQISITNPHEQSERAKKLLILYYKCYWTDFIRSRSRPLTIKSWKGISI